MLNLRVVQAEWLHYHAVDSQLEVVWYFLKRLAGCLFYLLVFRW